MKKHVGIVLKSDKFDEGRFLVFDRYYGKVSCLSYNCNVISGALISYFLNKRVHSYKYHIKELSLLAVPFTVAKIDIFFMHHVLELCINFLPWKSSYERAFDLVALLYDSENMFYNTLWKKVFLFKLLISFGLYTDSAPFSILAFHKLSSESIDSILRSNLHLEIERCVDAWLFSCVRAHPKFENFKTVRFLKRIGCHEEI